MEEISPPAESRLQGMRDTGLILGVSVPAITLPIAPGRNLAVLVECAVRDHILRLGGYRAEQDMMARMEKAMAREMRMRIIIVSGLSGSGKTIALQTLEDLDYYCVDNLPFKLIRPLAQEILAASELLPPTVAVGVDARNFIDELHQFPALSPNCAPSDLRVEVVFLQAGEEILLKRYSETRRRHPLDLGNMPLREAIRRNDSCWSRLSPAPI
jgi:hypothetical protein